MGLRVADEYNDRKSSFLSPAETVKSLLVNCTLQMMGIKL